MRKDPSIDLGWLWRVKVIQCRTRSRSHVSKELRYRANYPCNKIPGGPTYMITIHQRYIRRTDGRTTYSAGITRPAIACSRKDTRSKPFLPPDFRVHKIMNELAYTHVIICPVQSCWLQLRSARFMNRADRTHVGRQVLQLKLVGLYLPSVNAWPGSIVLILVVVGYMAWRVNL